MKDVIKNTVMMLMFIIIFGLLTGIISPVSAATTATCRSASVKHKFDKLNGFPNGRKGYVVDHVCALECGGLDIVENMQYQTITEGKLKDKWERKPAGCVKTCTPTNSSPTRTVFNCK